jgi:hypothetical protein
MTRLHPCPACTRGWQIVQVGQRVVKVPCAVCRRSGSIAVEFQSPSHSGAGPATREPAGRVECPANVSEVA